MPKKISVENALHYTWGGNCDGWHLLKNETLSVIEERMEAGSAEQLHFHHNAQQLFYILSGEANFTLDKETVILCKGDSLHVLPEVPHKISNHSTTELRFLVVSSPPSHGDRVNL